MAKKKQIQAPAGKSFRLKPGNHAFVPGSHAVHNNDNTSAENLAFYLKAYPHIERLLEKETTETNQNTAEQSA